jgi:hypothetical protein
MATIDPQPVARPFGQMHLEVAAKLPGARLDIGGDAFGAQRFEHCVGQPRIKIGKRNVMTSDEPVVATWHTSILHEKRGGCADAPDLSQVSRC